MVIVYFFQGSASPPAGSSSSTSAVTVVSLALAAAEIISYTREANSLGDSTENPLVRSAVSYMRSTMLLAPLSLGSFSHALFRLTTISWLGLSSRIFFPLMYSRARLSPMAWARMIFSMLALQPNLDVTSMHGEFVMALFETTTFSTFWPRTSFIQSQSLLNSPASSSLFFFISSSSSSKRRSSFDTSMSSVSPNLPKFATQTSSMGSTRYRISISLLRSSSTKGEPSAISFESAAT
mmetsp:Transcript_13614/g.34246  ORF Transcript_13614/g.34246 Transcript_13614/m.34246 type:complete len:237 (+) Transcript_13614:987-1697(+)